MRRPKEARALDHQASVLGRPAPISLLPAWPNPKQFARVVAQVYTRRKLRQIVMALEAILDQQTAEPENRQRSANA